MAYPDSIPQEISSVIELVDLLIEHREKDLVDTTKTYFSPAENSVLYLLSPLDRFNRYASGLNPRDGRPANLQALYSLKESILKTQPQPATEPPKGVSCYFSVEVNVVFLDASGNETLDTDKIPHGLSFFNPGENGVKITSSGAYKIFCLNGDMKIKSTDGQGVVTWPVNSGMVSGASGDIFIKWVAPTSS